MAHDIKTNIVILVSGLIVTAAGLAGLITLTDPFASGALVHGTFYILSFLATSCLLSLIGIAIRTWIFRRSTEHPVKASMRQGILIALLLTVSLSLQAQDLLFWWVEISLVLFVIFLEIFLST